MRALRIFVHRGVTRKNCEPQQGRGNLPVESNKTGTEEGVPGTTGKERRIVRSFPCFCTSRWLYNGFSILYNISAWHRFHFAAFSKIDRKEPHDLMSMTELYSTEEFERKYTYSGSDLGARWTREKTSFRLWAPTAKSVTINLYKSGNPGVEDRIRQIVMQPAVAGTWTAVAEGDLHGIYYTYTVELEEGIREACDPYARATGVNGHRAMILDLRSTDPRGWESDRNPNAGRSITDAVIYELHVRDLSTDPSSGIANKGKFLGVIEEGTRTPGGIPTGLDHIKSMGITHLHLLPSYDYGSVDEAHPEIPQFNWGYDPVNFNVPEGSYATDPFHGEIRVKEMKQMVQGLHKNGISVIMDVVYNHVYDGDSFCFNRIVPEYFSRTHYGHYSNGSGCGNDTASERSMVHKYIVDSVLYWADEYHIDGFRFDLVGLIDVDTINELVSAVRAKHPDVIFYGEGWSMGTELTKPDVAMATQYNAYMTPNFAYFSDTLRDVLRGSVFDDRAYGYVAGAWGQEDLVKKCFMGHPDWCPSPTQTINYASCHDNMSLFDRLTQSVPGADFAERVRMNNLAAAIYLLSQGVPFMQAGEELLRSKPLPGGGFEHNSYRSPDSVNSIKWSDLHKDAYAASADYYRGLIAFRKAHPTLRLTTEAAVREQLHALEGLESNVVGFHLRGSVDDPATAIIVLFNPNKTPTTVELPKGRWNVCIADQTAGTASLMCVEGGISVAPISATVLTLEPVKPILTELDLSEKKLPLLLSVTAAVTAAVGGAVAYLTHKRKKDKDNK